MRGLPVQKAVQPADQPRQVLAREALDLLLQLLNAHGVMIRLFGRMAS